MGLQKHQGRQAMEGHQVFWFFYQPGNWPLRYNTTWRIHLWMLTFDIALLYSVMCVLFRCLMISKFMVEQWA